MEEVRRVIDARACAVGKSRGKPHAISKYSCSKRTQNEEVGKAKSKEKVGNGEGNREALSFTGSRERWRHGHHPTCAHDSASGPPLACSWTLQL